MSEHFSSKEYGEYFAQLEQRISGGDNSNPQKYAVRKHTENDEKARKVQTDKRVTSSSRTCAAKKPARKPVHKKISTIRFVGILTAAAVLFGMAFTVKAIVYHATVGNGEKTTSKKNESNQKQNQSGYAKTTSDTVDLTADEDYSAIQFISCDTDTVVAAKNSSERVYPASTTKLMTLLVAADKITDYNDTLEITYQITDPLFKAGATVVGFSAGEIVTMNDLLYGTILPSGGDAAIGLAQKIAGSEEQFVALMNTKAEELGLKNTHFTNCTGLFDENHYTTAEDMAVILRAVMKNDICRRIISTENYTTSKTDKHPDGIDLQGTIFQYMNGEEPDGAVILGGKTGYVNESGHCFATFGKSVDGKEYVCVVLGGKSKWPAIKKLINLYSLYAK